MNKIYWYLNTHSLAAYCEWSQTLFHWLRGELHQYSFSFPPSSGLDRYANRLIRGDDYA